MRRLTLSEDYGFYKSGNTNGHLGNGPTLEKALWALAFAEGIVQAGEELEIRSTQDMIDLLESLFGDKRTEGIIEGVVAA